MKSKQDVVWRSCSQCGGGQMRMRLWRRKTEPVRLSQHGLLHFNGLHRQTPLAATPNIHILQLVWAWH